MKLFALILLAVLARTDIVYAHGVEMRIGSSQPDGGQLRIGEDFEFHGDVFLPEFASLGGQTLYKEIIPSFTWARAGDDSGLNPLDDSVQVRIVVTEVAAGAAVRIGSRTLDDPSDPAAVIGSFDPDPEAHVHPEWQLILPDGVTGRYSISFKLTTSAAGFSESPVYSLTLTNIAPVATATPTTAPQPSATSTLMATATMPPSTPTEEPPSVTPTTTATVPPSATATATQAATSSCRGDCDGDAMVTVDEIVRAVALALGVEGAEACAAVDANDDGQVTVDEIVRSIRSALDGCAAE